MHWLQSLDVALLRFINLTLSNPFFDWLMPLASGKGIMSPFFVAVFVIGGLMLCKGGARGRICALMLALIVGPGDGLICNLLKDVFARQRPFWDVADLHVLVGRGHSFGMPSSHAANWFAAAMILFVYYRRSILFMLPMACLVAFSRVYNGVHYPSDVIGGAMLGAGYAVAGMWGVNALWQFIGRRWFPLWWERLPSLVNFKGRVSNDESESDFEPEPEDQKSKIKNQKSESIDSHWVRLGYVVIALTFIGRLIYLGSRTIQLSGDEAYQWTWSKHLALSYFSKPPMIAWTQALGTALWGDNEFGVRFFSPVIGVVMGWLVLRFFAREVNARAGFILLLVMSTTPLLAVGGILMTVDPLSVLFWTAAMFSGWRAIQSNSTTRPWLWTGVWMGLGFLSKYTALFQYLCWAVFFVLWKPARAQLRQPGPYLALLISLVLMLPVFIWNAQHDWVTVGHVADDARVGQVWKPQIKYFLEFIGSEAGLLNPVYSTAVLWASIAFWRRGRHDPRLVYLFSMGAPLFLSYWLFTFHSRVLPNWIAPSVIPLFCLAAIYWDTRFRLGVRAIKGWLVAGFCLGAVLLTFMHETELVRKVAGKPLPSKVDPIRRVRNHRNTAAVVNEARTKLLEEGKPVFIIGGHYQMTGLISFYLPEARTNVATAPLVYFMSSDHPINQYYFWPGYRGNRTGQNAIFVRELGLPDLVSGWPRKWLSGETNLVGEIIQPEPPPESITAEFESVTDLGLREVVDRGRVFHLIQIFECRNLK